MVGWRLGHWFIVIALGLPACSPKTQNVRAFSTSVLDTNERLESVLALGYPSCVRGAEYHMLKSALAVTPDTQAELEASYAKRLETCELTKRIESQALEAAAVVTAFAAALGNLANDQPVEHIPTDAAGASMPTATGPGKAEEKAKSEGAPKPQMTVQTDDVVKTISKWVTAGYRQKQLGKAISESAEPIQDVLAALATVTKEVNVEGLLQQEERNLLELFEIYDLESPADAVARDLRHLERQRLQQDIHVRLSNTARFRERLARLILAHEALVQAQGALKQEELLAQVRAALADTFAQEPLPAPASALRIPAPAPEGAPAPSVPAEDERP